MPSHAASSGNTERAAPRPNCTIATGSSRHSTPLYATRTLVLLAPALLVFEVCLLVCWVLTGLTGLQILVYRRVIADRRRLSHFRGMI